MTGSKNVGRAEPARAPDGPQGVPNGPQGVPDVSPGVPNGAPGVPNGPQGVADGPPGVPDVPGTITVMLTLERPSHQELRHYSRREKYRALRSSARGIREELMRWIGEHGLEQDVVQVGEPTAFHTLFVTSTRYAAARLVDAPGVIDVSPTGDWPASLFSVPELPPPDDDTATE